MSHQPTHCQVLERRLLLDADFNNDGNTDLLYFDRQTGQVTVVYLDDDKRAISTATITTVGNLDWRVVAVDDIDGDDRTDLLWQNEATGRLLLWRMNNRQILGFVSYPSANPAVWDFAAASEIDDADGNGPDREEDHLALLWRHKTDGRLVLWHLDGRQILRTIQLGQGAGAQWQVAGMGDVELEPGKAVDLQILWRNTANGANRIWQFNDSKLVHSVVLPGAGPAWSVAGFADAEGDDDEGDIYWRNFTTGQNVEWEFDDNYVRVKVNTLPAEPNVNKVLFVGD